MQIPLSRLSLARSGQRVQESFQDAGSAPDLSQASWGAVETGTVLGPYEVVERIGSGGMGDVYLARDTRLRRRVALKLVRDDRSSAENRERLLREARTAATLNHPNVCIVHDVGEAGGELYIGMEYLEGRLLREVIVPGGLPIESVIHYGAQVAAALDHAHQHGIVHGDLKSNNVIITRTGDAKVLDFGLARRIRKADLEEARSSRSVLTEESQIGGTLPYMAPEMLRGEAVDERTDLWALGVLLYELAAGHKPFRGRTPFELTTAVQRDPPPALPASVPPGLRAVIGKCLAKDPSQRYQHANEVEAALEALFYSETTAAVRPLLEAERGAARRTLLRRVSPWAWLAAALVAVLAVVGTWLLLRLQPPPDTIALAVLPFSSPAEPESSERLGDVIAEGLSARLQQAPGAIMAPYLDVLAVRQGMSPSEVASFLGVEWVIHGVVATYNGHVRLNLHFTSKGGVQRPATTIQGQLARLDPLFEEAVASVLAILDLPPAERQDPLRTPDVRALAKYVEALDYDEQWDEEGSLKRAVELFREALAIDRQFHAANARLALALASLYVRDNRSEYLVEAMERASSAVRHQPSLPEAHLAMGAIRLLRGETPLAQQSLDQAMALAPGNDAALRYLARLYRNQDRPDEAEAAYQRAIALRPELWQNHYDLARFEFVDRGNAAGARPHAEKAVELNPKSQAALVLLGMTFFQEGELKAAERQYQRALDLGPNRHASSDLGLIYYSEGNYNLALRHFRDALEAAPDRPGYHANVADALRQLGDADAARQHYQRALAGYRARLELSPDDDEDRGAGAIVLAALGRCVEARGEIAVVLDRNPDAPFFLYYAAIAEGRCGDETRAQEFVLKLAERGDFRQEMRSDPDLELVRRDPRVRAALEMTPASVQP